MARQITATFLIKISGATGNYTIEASGPQRIKVTSQPFVWNPTPVQQKTIDLLRTRAFRVTLDQLIDLGQAMRRAIFIPEIERAYGGIQHDLEGDNGARIKLLIKPLELARLPWELMHDGREFIALLSDFPLVRGISEAQIARQTSVGRSLKILYAWAAPEDLGEIHPKATAEAIGQILADNKRIKFDILPEATRDTLITALDEDYHILCFAGHGDERKICLEKKGQSDPDELSYQAFSRILEGKNATRLVFLAACKTGGSPSEELAGFAQSLAAQGNIPAVVAMQYDVKDNEANQLTARYFQAIAAFRPVDAALAEARKSIADERKSTREIRDVFAPVMYLQTETSNLFQRARNWVAIMFAALSFLALVAFLVQTLVFQPDRANIVAAQSTAQAEATARFAAEATAVLEAQGRIEQESIARSRRLSAEAKLLLENMEGENLPQTDEWEKLDLALLIGVEAYHSADTYEARDSLLRTLLYQPRLIAYLHDANGFVEFTSDSQNLVTIIRSNPYDSTTISSIGIWSLDARTTTVRALPYLGESQLPISITADGNMLAMPTEQGFAIWNTENGQLQYQSPHRDGEVMGLSFSSDSQHLAASNCVQLYENACQVGEITIVSVNQSTPTETVLIPNTVAYSDIAFSPNGTLLAAYSENAVYVWDVSTGHQEAYLTGEIDINGFTFSADNNYIAATGTLAEAVVASTGAEAYEGILIWDLATQHQISQITGYSYWIDDLAFSPDGHMLATGSCGRGGPRGSCVWGGEIRLWDIATGELIDQWIAHGDWVFDVQFSPDGRSLASSGYDGVKLWSVTSNQPLQTIYAGNINPETGYPPETIPNDQSWELTAEGASIVLKNVESGQTLGPFCCQDYSSNVAAISHNGQFLAWGNSAGWDTSVVLANLNTGQMSRPLTIPSGGTAGISFTPDDSMVVLANYFNLALVDVKGEQLIGKPLEGGTACLSIGMSSDGKNLVCILSDNSIYLWDISPASWASKACRIANRNMTTDEWQKYMGKDIPYRKTCSDVGGLSEQTGNDMVDQAIKTPTPSDKVSSDSNREKTNATLWLLIGVCGLGVCLSTMIGVGLTLFLRQKHKSKT